MDPIIEAMKLRLGLRGSPIELPSKLSPNVLKLVKMKRANQSQYEHSPLINFTPNSVTKLHKKPSIFSRKSCNSQQTMNDEKFATQHPEINIAKNSHVNLVAFSCSKVDQAEKQKEQPKREQKPEDREKSRAQTKAYRTALLKNRVSTHVDIDLQIRKKNNNQVKKKCMCGQCQQCLKDFNHFLNIFSTDKSLPEISAKSWCIWKKGKVEKFTHYYGKRIHKVREIASLTKMITAMTAVDFMKAHNYDANKITYRIRKSSTLIGGTSAGLEIDQVYTINQLLFGMMLPSGNDAAIAISQALGLLIHLKNKNKHVNPHKQLWYQQYQDTNSKSSAYLFVNSMMEKCQKMGLLDTKIYNSHGNDAFDNMRNISTCNQIGKISAEYVEKYEQLKHISNTKHYQVRRYNKRWENTNKLLEDGFEGIKTGVNESSGPCLSACYRDLIIIVLNSRTTNERWVEVKKLVRWIMRKGVQ